MSTPDFQYPGSTAVSSNTSPSSSLGSQGDLCVEINNEQQHQISPSPFTARYLELCINTGPYRKVVAEIDLTFMKTDAELFTTIAESYRRNRASHGVIRIEVPFPCHKVLRKKRFEMSFTKPSKIISRKFLLDRSQSPQVAVGGQGLPPKVEIERRRYSYKSAEITADGVMPPHQFFHLFHNPSPHTSETWTPFLPKKLGTSIFVDDLPEVLKAGYGIHIVETLDCYMLSLVTFLTLIGSGIFAIAWAAVTKDVQGAFSIGTYAVGVMTAALGTVGFGNV
ncbi:uncharacterized protein KY384_007444 [Bacidia gigantensis]|uniref:uncharacterized protein n=1 Tax=Bacidia gigantensis TaxID=2732470 RepID=UPI001D057FA0|nr:uncharacterized protein KY384_007444 [Bacidia gigantensis]KAG8528526.1 hypothetical protein KY384_007444 [Bacidia gigantensis]